jgi:hypothetical protein
MTVPVLMTGNLNGVFALRLFGLEVGKRILRVTTAAVERRGKKLTFGETRRN